VSQIIEKCGEKMIIRFFAQRANKIGQFRYELAKIIDLAQNELFFLLIFNQKYKILHSAL